MKKILVLVSGVPSPALATSILLNAGCELRTHYMVQTPHGWTVSGEVAHYVAEQEGEWRPDADA